MPTYAVSSKCPHTLCAESTLSHGGKLLRWRTHSYPSPPRRRERESVLFIGTQFSNLYTAVDTPAKGRVGIGLSPASPRRRGGPPHSRQRIRSKKASVRPLVFGREGQWTCVRDEFGEVGCVLVTGPAVGAPFVSAMMGDLRLGLWASLGCGTHSNKHTPTAPTRSRGD
jgi:hypothetical protein